VPLRLFGYLELDTLDLREALADFAAADMHFINVILGLLDMARKIVHA
jgi:hypothetical protein